MFCRQLSKISNNGKRDGSLFNFYNKYNRVHINKIWPLNKISANNKVWTCPRIALPGKRNIRNEECLPFCFARFQDRNSFCSVKNV
ncbi:MAG: hypothetical protein BGO54_18340 [Sphingobacteriales bacterium 46-32]|nr:MAG: hypothetical protein BGO54_18340 [Sphingobacteriales bacterium 46-32]